MLLLLAFALAVVQASPVQHNNRRWTLRPRDGGDSDQRVPIQIWIPITVVVILLLVVAAVTWSRRALRPGGGFLGLGSRSQVARNPLPSNNGSREVTAEQLAGTINSRPVAGAANRGRRTRRPRRTPSQISTTSLPAYMKDPGEQELVVIRSPQDLQDMPIPLATVVTEESDEQRDSIYRQVPESPQHQPLLQEADITRQTTLHPPNAETSSQRTTGTSNAASEETSSLLRISSRETGNERDASDPRGPTPSYFEVVDLSTDALPQASNSQDAPGIQGDETIRQSTQPTGQRRSAFRNFFGAFGNQGGNRASVVQASTSGHNRGDSSGSTASDPRPSASSHRPSQSSGSRLSIYGIRSSPLSRKKSTNTLNSAHLTSPSTISINSISSPLPHTLVRTDFTYPKSGPTPEQLKLISSRESFARFGVPYGAEAIAWANASRGEVDRLPPGFEEATASTSALPENNANEPSMTHSPSSDRFVAGNASPTHRPQLSTDIPLTTITNLTDTAIVESPTHESTTEHDSHGDTPNTTKLTTSRAPSTSSTISAAPTITPAQSIPVIPTSLNKQISSPSTSQVPSSPLALQTPSTSASTVPPSSFKAPQLSLVTDSTRPESRASSFRSLASYATAAESLQGYSEPETPTNGSIYHTDSEPTTPTTPTTLARRRDTIVQG